jgi:hypothetical protein
MKIHTLEEVENAIVEAVRLFESDTGMVVDYLPQENPGGKLFEDELDFVVELGYMNGTTIGYYSFESEQDAETFIAHIRTSKSDIKPWEKLTNAETATRPSVPGSVHPARVRNRPGRVAGKQADKKS